MKKNNLEFVDRILIGDVKDYVELIADAVFSIDDNGEAVYRPYMFEEAFELGFYIYGLTGIDFEFITDEQGNQELEDIMNACRADGEIYEWFCDVREDCLDFEYGTTDNSDLVKQLRGIRSDAMDLIDFRKSEHLAHKQDVIGEFAKAAGQIARLLEAVDYEHLDSNIIVQSLVTAFAKTPAFEQYLYTVNQMAKEIDNADTDNKETNIAEVPEDSKRNS